ncbi:DUF1800 domain-containing protein [Ramlibacter solisilvae]|uniref:DUF1800 domain-containing protein n=1 Tax=Ramlibacter tataouinensis TaxID=94132 RepID=UPI000777B6AF|nr:DUF1800 domain-containing protein [Ramlibacter tataouinensis]
MIARRRLLQAAAASTLARPVLAAAPPQRIKLAPEQSAAHLLNRLGFGPRPGELDAVGKDPRGWMERQLRPQELALPATLIARLDESKFTTPDPLPAVRDYVQRIRENQKAGADDSKPENPVRLLVRSYQLPAVESRLFRALESPRQLEETMVDFWFNHFNVFQGKGFLRMLAGHYEHSAIRPHAMGRFRDLLVATAHHPAMLYYLDNWQSVGPQGQARGRGLNENYARELMELHTLGVDGGYTQEDVTQLARMFTGWTFQGPFAQNMRPTGDYGFVFNPRLHDNGDKTWMGQRVPARGKAEGDDALELLARHPATARHVSFKLAQYFVSDTPPAALVQKMAAAFLAQDGQIVPVLRVLFTSDEFWSGANVATKFKTPYHYTLSALRAGGWRVATGLPLAVQLARQGMPLYGCPTPDGYKNTEVAWLSADAMAKRLDIAAQLGAGRLGNERLIGVSTVDELMDNLGPLVTPATRAMVSDRETPAAGLALALAGPGMMRR